MLIFPTCRVVFQEAVKSIGHTLHKDCCTTAKNAALGAIFLRHNFIHSCVDLDTLREMSGLLSQCQLHNDTLTASAFLLYDFSSSLSHKINC